LVPEEEVAECFLFLPARFCSTVALLADDCWLDEMLAADMGSSFSKYTSEEYSRRVTRRHGPVF
jgi:hypothetical protein